MVLATGVGLARFLAVADGASRGSELREALRRATVVCRGPKPVAVLKREGLTAHVRAPARAVHLQGAAKIAAAKVRRKVAVDEALLLTLEAASGREGAALRQVQPHEEVKISESRTADLERPVE